MNTSDIKNLDQYASSYKEDFTPDTEAALARMRTRLPKSVEPKGAVVRPLGKFWWTSAVAVALLLLTAGYFVFAGDGVTEYANTSGAPMAVALPDGTDVLLQEGAILSYPVDYNETDRHIQLKGQAFFEVEKDADRPFLVTTAETELRVTGTAFNLRIEEDEMEVEVSEGRVELHRQGLVVPVIARQCGLAVLGKKCAVMEAQNLNRHAWRTGTLTFNGTPFNAAIKTISNNFGMDIKVPADCDFPVSGNFVGQNPVDVLRTIASMNSGKLEELAADSYQFSGISCGN